MGWRLLYNAGTFSQPPGLLVNRVAELAAALAEFAVSAKEAALAADGAEINTFIEQRWREFPREQDQRSAACAADPTRIVVVEWSIAAASGARSRVKSRARHRPRRPTAAGRRKELRNRRLLDAV